MMNELSESKRLWMDKLYPTMKMAERKLKDLREWQPLTEAMKEMRIAQIHELAIYVGE